MAVWVFWLSGLLLVYPYVIYPLLVGALGTVFARRVSRRAITPTVSVLIPAYNEEAVIRQKIENTLSLDYPREQLEIVVASDGSTDGTCDAASQYADRGVKLLEFDRGGKAMLLNRAMPSLRGDIVMFTDASCLLDAQALRRLVMSFADPSVGSVCGQYRFMGSRDSMRSTGEGLYWRIETWLKRKESALSSILGAHGACYAIRRSLFVPLPPRAINDDYIIPMQVVAQGYRAVYDDTVLSEEQTDVSAKGEVARRMRITAGNYQQVGLLWRLLHPKYGWIAWQFFSHKVVRAFSPIPLCGVFVSSLLLLDGPSIYRLAFMGQLVFYAMAAMGAVCEKMGCSARLFVLPFYFCLANIASFFGFFRFLFNAQRPAWEKVE